MQIIHCRKIADFLNDGDGNESSQKVINLRPVHTPGSDIFFSGLNYGPHVQSTSTPLTATFPQRLLSSVSKGGRY